MIEDDIERLKVQFEMQALAEKDWLQKNNIQTQTKCVIYALSFTGFSLRNTTNLLSISTAEI